MSINAEQTDQNNGRKLHSLPKVINLNVGGRTFATRLSTLQKYPDSMLAGMFSGRHELDKDDKGSYFIDRDGTYFEYILNFLRNEDDVPPFSVTEEVLKEAVYYSIQPLVNILQSSPIIFAEHVVRENLRQKLENYHDVKSQIIRLAHKEAEEDHTIISTVKLIIFMNQPIPRDLQVSKQMFKQYYRKFAINESFEECFGKYYVKVPYESIKEHPDLVMNHIAGCIVHDIKRLSYNVSLVNEKIKDDGKYKTVKLSDNEFYVCMSCHNFTFDWLK
ncbi:hypothetical protein CHS0354_010426 [Potamilus streckersoni]|uniref:BTB domain-containing protein n=1 Tax=Potamilus streckersoni TaxID=2493646 RepID=A0AAE0SLM0_9BIVA|nr:hypothetical protein CHS0354_010426 [Potamilus streckersoni]